MQDIINGGMYAVNFQGNREYEFIGIHPAIVVRTLKEKELYFCVPLTTYTKERWLKIKEMGFGCRILSTNSIARIDKLQIVESRQMNNRWVNSETNEICVISYEELEYLNKRLNEYLSLSSAKALKEYSKYLSQYTYIKEEVIKAYKEQTTIFTVEKSGNIIKLNISKTTLNNLSIKDLQNILKVNINGQFEIQKVDNGFNIIITS